MALTEHQTEVHDEGIDILRTSHRIVIKGSAGVGKTFLADTMIDSFDRLKPSSWKRILCSAPTNKAVAVLKGKVKQRDNLDFSTIHSALKLKRNVDRKTGAISFKPAFNPKYPPFKGLKLIVIDEASMIGLDLLMDIEEYATRFAVTVVFLGDDKQLNPVNEEDSPVFLGKPLLFSDKSEALEFANENDYKYWDRGTNVVVFEPYPEVELTEIVRQGQGNPIIDLSRNIGKIQEGVEKVFVNDDEVTGYTYTTDRQRIIDRLARVNGTDELKYLAWTNKEVDEMNIDVRKKIYGNPAKIELGETLVFNNPYGEKYFTNEEITVNTLRIIEQTRDVMVKHNPITEESVTMPLKLKLYIINEEDEGGVRVVHEESDDDYKNITKIMNSNCRARLFPWKDYFTFTESFGDLKYNHAITVHKSQGSTYTKTIVNVKNLSFNRNKVEKARLFYTAVTRASKLLILYNV